ncbi:MAG: carboxypeptidase regulatory-like domain-containing protein [Chloroflexi bacterium]|nr:carboxypeptidase regulatory-like domain-containing protein [Chloroflexota bacterium]
MTFQPNQQIYTCTAVNLRAAPGYRGDVPPAVLAILPARTVCTVIGAATVADELTWWPVSVVLTSGQILEGWVAEAVGEDQLLAAMPVEPPPMEPPAPAQVPGNRLGFYLHATNNDNGLWDAISRARPPVMLIHEDAANDMLLNEIRAFRAPNALIVGRYYVTNEAQRAMLESGDPTSEGQRFAERILGYDFGKFTKRAANGRLFIDAWMSLNESLPGPASSSYREQPETYHRLYDAYDRFQVAFRARLMQEGIEAVAFNFAAGNFTEPAHYLSFFPQTLAASTYLGFHEYGWPALMPGAGVETSAGLYRGILAAVRAQYGGRHQVIITEAGLTRAYGHPENPDEGWLNQREPLDENRYWESLAWYNSQLGQDQDVVGACLYQVGHRGDWATFRHLGADNEGRNLHLIDRIGALADQAIPRAVQGLPTRRVTFTGRVFFGAQPVAGATVRLVGHLATLGNVRGAAWDQPGAISWSRPVTGFSGNLRNAWDRFVAREVAGLTWHAFKQQAFIANPALAQSGGHFVGNQTYYLPAAATVTPAFLWDRVVTGYSGTLDQAWRDLVQGKVAGINYASFRRQFAAYNPTLDKKSKHLLASHTYMLPRTTGEDRYVLTVTTTAAGRFRLANLPEGTYRVEVEAAGMQPFVADVTLRADLPENLAVEIGLEPLLTAVQARGTGGDAFMGVIGREFVVQGHILRFIGVNLRGLIYYGSGRTSMLQYTTSAHRQQAVQQAQAMGASVVRVFLPCVNATIVDTIALLHTTLDVIESQGLYLIPAFVDFYKSTDFRIPGDDHFYARLDPDPNFTHELLKGEFYRDGYQERYLPFVRAIVAEFKNDPRIFAWEIGNELKYEPAYQDPGRAAFLAFMQGVAREIKRIDANHLVTTGMISTSHASLDEGNLWRQLYGGPEFDFLTVHCYNEEYANKPDYDYARVLNKPFIIEEAGFGQHYAGVRVEQTRRDMDRWFGFGASGYMQWGFMPVGGDIGDGDTDSGMDRQWHGNDFDELFTLYRERATALKAQVDSLPQPIQPLRPNEWPIFQVGQPVYTQTGVRLRQTPGYVGKEATDTLAILDPGQALMIIGASTVRDELTWWCVRYTPADNPVIEGWVAQAADGAWLLADTMPTNVPRGIGLQPRG